MAGFEPAASCSQISSIRTLDVAGCCPTWRQLAVVLARPSLMPLRVCACWPPPEARYVRSIEELGGSIHQPRRRSTFDAMSSASTSVAARLPSSYGRRAWRPHQCFGRERRHKPAPRRYQRFRHARFWRCGLVIRQGPRRVLPEQPRRWYAFRPIGARARTLPGASGLLPCRGPACRRSARQPPGPGPDVAPLGVAVTHRLSASSSSATCWASSVKARGALNLAGNRQPSGGATWAAQGASNHAWVVANPPASEVIVGIGISLPSCCRSPDPFAGQAGPKPSRLPV